MNYFTLDNDFVNKTTGNGKMTICLLIISISNKILGTITHNSKLNMNYGRKGLRQNLHKNKKNSQRKQYNIVA